MPTLAIIMIVRNESACLESCLESVAAIADEIIIGDTGSSDDTADVARRFTPKVLDIVWRNDFSAARNAVLRHTTADWLLHMDADECLDPESAARIRQTVDADGNGSDAFEVTLANYCDEPRAWRWTPSRPGDPFARGHAGYLAVPLLRLFRNGRGFEYREPVHENITESVLELGGVVGRLDVLIHHYGYAPANAQKAVRYLSILEAKAAARPDDAKALHDLAEQLVSMDRADEAEPLCRRVLERDPLDLPAATTLANLLLNRGDTEEASHVLETLERHGIAPPHVLTALAAVDIREGRLDAATARLDGALTQAPNHILARLYVARAADLAGHPPEAQRHLELACGFAPGLPEPVARLRALRFRLEADNTLRSGDHRMALALYVQALKEDPEDPLVHWGLARTLDGLGDPRRAAESRERALLLAPSLAATVHEP
ncbi:MAG: hypothetical protein AMXMBFR84_30750 [Candidatus Hydrogenedentota bacterium]